MPDLKIQDGQEIEGRNTSRKSGRGAGGKHDIGRWTALDLTKIKITIKMGIS
jgi:hypothetical protein